MQFILVEKILTWYKEIKSYFNYVIKIYEISLSSIGGNQVYESWNPIKMYVEKTVYTIRMYWSKTLLIDG